MKFLKHFEACKEARKTVGWLQGDFSLFLLKSNHERMGKRTDLRKVERRRKRDRSVTLGQLLQRHLQETN